MQLGKLGASQQRQALSRKTGLNRAQFDQWLTSEKQNLQLLDLVVERDDGRWATSLHDDGPGFESRLFAMAVASRAARVLS